MATPNDLGTRMAHFEDLLKSATDDIAEVRDVAIQSFERLARRVDELESVRVRALEDWRLSQSVLERERRDVSSQAARTAQDVKDRQLTRTQFMVGQAVFMVVSIFSGLVASGKLF